MRQGKFYSVGVGPGDPTLITLKAVNTVKRCDVICVPQSSQGKNLALDIASEYLDGKEILFCKMPMTRDKEVLDAHHNLAADRICRLLIEGKDVAFLTLGDPGVYSTNTYVHKKIMNRGFETEIVPGITSFCAAAASLNIPLCEAGETLHIIPASYDDLENNLSLKGPKVLMKAGGQFKTMKKRLIELKKENAVMMVECATMANEKIYAKIEDADDSGYFSLIVVKEKEAKCSG